MRFTLLNQYYVPDLAPTGRMLHDLARTLVARGHRVDVVCSRDSYQLGPRHPPREIIEGVTVHRVAGVGSARGGVLARLLSYASFFVLAGIRLVIRAPRPDLILSLTTPPYLGLLGRWAARLRGAVHAHWVMDVYPDVIEADGMADRQGFVLRLLRRLGRHQFRGAGLVLAPGSLVERRLRDQYTTPATPVAWVPLWASGFDPADPASLVQIRHERGWETDVVLLYSGNMGRGHRFDEMLEASRRLGRAGPLWAFVGEGVQAHKLREFARAHPEARLQFLPYVAPPTLAASLAAADVHLVSLSARWQGLIVPSKLQAAFSVGRPAIFVGSPESEVGQWIVASGGGWVVQEGDIERLLEAVREACDPAERSRRGAAALAFARGHFDQKTNCERIVELLERSRLSPEASAVHA